jgi:hypothetical protein
MGRPGQLTSIGPAHVDPPLPVGTYTVEVEHEGFRAGRAEAVVKTGETTMVEIPMRPP